MFDSQTIRRQRLSALSNGVLIGLGIATLLIGGASSLMLSLVPVAAGVGIEFWQRRRLPR